MDRLSSGAVMNVQVLFAFIVYFCLVLAVGIIASRRSKAMSETDFIMGGRGLNFWVTALSAHASDMSAWLFMAFPAAVFVGGAPACWIALGLMIGMFLSWQFVAPRLRQQTEDLDSYTLATFFERRFRDHSGMIRLVTAILTVVFFSHYLAALVRAVGVMLGPIFHIDYLILISIVMTVVVLYTVMGGYVTVAYIDLFQALFLLAVVLFVPAFAYLQLSDPSDIVALAQDKEIALALVPSLSKDWIIEVVTTAVSWGLGYFGMPHVLTKFMGIKHVSEMYKSKYVGMTWLVFTLTGAAAVGFIGIAFFPIGLDNPELVFIQMVQQLFHPFLGGLILCGIIAATLSTMDSQILCCATTISEDLYRRACRTPPKAKQLLMVSRLGVLFTAIVALLLALNKDASLISSVLYPWAGLGCTFGPLVILGLFSKKVNKYGAGVGILFGGLLTLFWPSVRHYFTDYTIDAIVFGFPIAMALIYLVSRLTEKHDRSYGVQSI